MLPACYGCPAYARLQMLRVQSVAMASGSRSSMGFAGAFERFAPIFKRSQRCTWRYSREEVDGTLDAICGVAGRRQHRLPSAWRGAARTRLRAGVRLPCGADLGGAGDRALSAAARLVLALDRLRQARPGTLGSLRATTHA